MNNSSNTLCFVYCATGKTFQEECHKSIASLLEAHDGKDVSIEVFTDDPKQFGERGHLIDKPVYGSIDKIKALRGTSFDRFIFLDTDTTVVRDLSDLFILLDKFDLLATQAPIRFQYPELETKIGPMAFPQYNGGVLAMRKNTQFLDAWEGNFEICKQMFSEAYTNLDFRGQDQISLRKTLLELPDFQFFTLPGEYNVRPFGGGFSGPPFIVHDRDFQNLDAPQQKRLVAHTRSFGAASQLAYPMAFLNGRKNTLKFVLRCIFSSIRYRRVMDYIAPPAAD